MKYEKYEISNKKIVAIAVPIVALVIFLFTMLYTVGAGEVGVIFDPLSGGIQSGEAGEGLHVKMPWQSVDIYNIKLQDYTMSIISEEGDVSRDDRITCVTNEGLTIDLDMTIWYRVVSTEASTIRQDIGRDGEYQQIVVRPQIRSSIREVVSQHEAIEVYGENRELIETEIFDMIGVALSPKNIIIESVLLRNVILPQTLTDAIEAKKQAEQEALRMVYVLERENLEAIRRVVEASGIADANDRIAGSLTSEYLQWYWISNLDSHDSVLYVPVGEYGLPLFREVE